VALQDMRAFIAHKTGSVRIRAGMYNQSGTYYFTFRVVEAETGNTVFEAGGGNGGYLAYEFPAGQAGNVHTYKYYEWVTLNLVAGNRYVIQMANSDTLGNTVFSHNQNLYLGELTVWSQSPGETYGAPLKIFQELGQTTFNVNYDYIREGVSTVPQTQNFRGTEETFLGWFSFRADARYLDIKTNLNSNGFMFFMRAHGYLYNDGVYNSAMAAGYMFTNNSVIVQQYSTPSGSRGFSSLYRASDGFLCAKLDKVGTGYTEGVVGLFFGAHGPAPADIRVTRYVQNNSGNYYA
jgi:hypothetical protein